MMNYWGKVMKYKIGQTVKVKNGVFAQTIQNLI